jgi:hypothetical protein
VQQQLDAMIPRGKVAPEANLLCVGGTPELPESQTPARGGAAPKSSLGSTICKIMGYNEERLLQRAPNLMFVLLCAFPSQWMSGIGTVCSCSALHAPFMRTKQWTRRGDGAVTNIICVQIFVYGVGTNWLWYYFPSIVLQWLMCLPVL